MIATQVIPNNRNKKMITKNGLSRLLFSMVMLFCVSGVNAQLLNNGSFKISSGANLVSEVDVINNGSFAISSGANVMSEGDVVNTATMFIDGSLIIKANFNTTSGLVTTVTNSGVIELLGDSAQILTGSFSIDTLRINTTSNNAGTLVSRDTVNSWIDFRSGYLKINSDLIVEWNSNYNTASTASTNSYIFTNAYFNYRNVPSGQQMTFPVGYPIDPTNDVYSPVTVTNSTLTNLGLKYNRSDPNIGTLPQGVTAVDVAEYWDFNSPLDEGAILTFTPSPDAAFTSSLDNEKYVILGKTTGNVWEALDSLSTTYTNISTEIPVGKGSLYTSFALAKMTLVPPANILYIESLENITSIPLDTIYEGIEDFNIKVSLEDTVKKIPIPYILDIAPSSEVLRSRFVMFPFSASVTVGDGLSGKVADNKIIGEGLKKLVFKLTAVNPGDSVVAGKDTAFIWVKEKGLNVLGGMNYNLTVKDALHADIGQAPKSVKEGDTLYIVLSLFNGDKYAGNSTNKGNQFTINFPNIPGFTPSDYKMIGTGGGVRDYLQVSGGNNADTLIFIAKKDAIVEGNVQNVFTLTNSTVDSIFPSQDTVTIIDDNTNASGGLDLDVTFPNSSVLEGDSAMFIIRIKGGVINGTASSITGTLSAVAPSSAVGADYSFSNNFTIPVGSNADTVYVKALKDGLIESTETLYIKADPIDVNNVISPNTGMINILDYETSVGVLPSGGYPVTISWSPSSTVSEGGSPIYLVASLPNNIKTADSIVVFLTHPVSPSTAMAGRYTMTNRIVIKSNSQKDSISFTAINDNIFQGTTKVYVHDSIDVNNTSLSLVSNESTPATILDYSDNEKISATSFTWLLDRVQSLVENTAKIAASVSGRDASGDDFTIDQLNVNDVELSDINNATSEGVYPLTFSTPSGKDTTISVVLFNNPGVIIGDTAISAKGFGWSFDSRATLDSLQSAISSELQAIRVSTGNAITTINVSLVELSAINNATSEGVYPLTFTVPNGPSITVPVALTNGDISVITDNEVITASGFSWKYSDRSSFTGNDGKIKSGVSAYTYTLGTLPTTTPELLSEITYPNGQDTVSIQTASSVNSYPLTFQGRNGAQIVVPVVLTDKDTVVVNPDGSIIGADYVVWNLADRSSFNITFAAKDTAHVSAINSLGTDITSTVTPQQHSNGGAEIQAIHSATAESVMPLTFTDENGNSLTTKVLLLSGNDTSVVISNNEALSAVDFAWSVDSLSSFITSNTYVPAQVKNWDLIGDSLIDVNTVMSDAMAVVSTVDPAIRTLQVKTLTYTTARGTKKSVKVVFSGGDSTVIKGNEAITASDFTIRVRNLPTLTALTSLVEAKVSAINTTTMTPIVLDATSVNSVELSQIKSETSPTQDPLTFTTPGGASITVDVYVTQNDTTTVINGTQSIGADGFSWMLDNATNLTDILAKDAANVYAFRDISVDPSVVYPRDSVYADTVQLTAIQNATIEKVYPLTFVAYPPGLQPDSVLIPVVLTSSDSGTLDPTNREYIGANNFTWEIGTSLSSTEAKTSSKVVAYSLVDPYPAITTISVDVSELNDINTATVSGPYPLTFSTPNNTSTRIWVIMGNPGDSTVIDPINKESITSHFFTWSLDNSLGLTSPLAKSSAGVVAYDISVSPAVLIDINTVITNANNLDSIQNATHGEGVYPISFSTSKGTSIGGHMLLTNNDTTGNNSGSKVLVSARGFGWDLSKSNLLSDESLVLSLAHALGFDYSTDPATILNPFLAYYPQQDSISSASHGAGVYPLDISAQNANSDTASTRIYGVLNDNDTTTVDIINEEQIAANNFSVRIDTVGSITIDGVKYSSGVHASNLVAPIVEVPFASIGLDTAQYNNIRTATTKGSYPLTFMTPKGTSVSVFVYVTDNDVVVIGDSASIGANHIKLTESEALSFDQSSSQILTDVKVTMLDPLATYTGGITGATVQEIQDINNLSRGIDVSYPLTFSDIYGDVITVYALVTNNNNVVAFDSTFMSARDFSISLDSASTLTGSAANILSNVYVSYFDNSLNPYTGTITADASNIASINMGQVDVSYPLMFRASNGDSIMIHVLVTNDDVFLPGDSSDFMVANNIQLSLLEAQSFTQPLSQSLTNVHVVMSDNSPYLGGISGATASEVQSIVDTTLGMEMSYPLTFTNDFGTELTVYALVTDNENVVSSDSEFISANNFSISVALAGTISDVETRTLSNVQVTNKDNSPYTGTITGATASELSAIHSGVEGESFPVTFTSSKGTSITVYVLVTDNNNVVAFDSTFMSARDFSISLDSASTLTGSAANILSNVYVSYFDNSLNPYTGTITADASNIASINMGQVDVSYPLMFRASNGDSIMIHVLVTNDDVFLPGDSSDFMVANNIQLSLLEAQSFTQPLSQSLTNVHVVMSDNSPYLGGISGATASEVQSIVDTTLGMEMSYPLTFTNDFGTELTVYALVTDNENVVSSDSEFISANNFSISVALAGTISDVETRTLSNVQVTNKDNSPYTGTITGATASELSAIHSGVEGESFPVTFTSSKGTSITVYVLVTDNNNVVAFDSTFMSARDFSISLDSASTLTGSAANILSNVYVSYFDNSLNPYTGTITADASNIASINMGQVDVSYPLMFRASNGDSIMIHVLVTNDDVFLPGDSSDFMVANNIQLSLLEAQSFTQPLSQSLTNVHVVMSDNSPYLGGISGATASEVQSIVDTTLGMEMSYPLTFTNDFGTELTVYALVTDNENVVSSDSEFISANNFSISVALAGTISDVETRTLSNVQVTNKDNSPYTGTITGATASELSAIHSGVEGESFPVTFTSSKGTSITVYVLVTDNNNVVAFDSTFMSARDFSISLDSASTLTGSAANILSNVYVSYFDNSLNPYTGTITADASNIASINMGQVDVSYPLMFRASNGDSIMIHVLVTNDDVFLPGDSSDFMVANNIQLSLLEAQSFTQPLSQSLTNVHVVMSDNSPYLGGISGATASEVQSIVDTTLGMEMSYPLTFTNDFGTELTVYALVTDNENVVSSDSEFISANNFSISVALAGTISDVETRTLSNVQVTNKDNSPYTGTITGATASELSAIHSGVEGESFPVTFTSSKGTSITVYVLVTDNNNVVAFDSTFMSARDFSISLDSASTLTGSAANILSNVYVSYFDNSLNPYTGTITADASNIASINMGQVDVSYPLMFRASNGDSIMIHVLVTNDDVFLPGDSSDFMVANNIQLSLLEAQSFTQPLSQSLTNVHVVMSDNSPYLGGISGATASEVQSIVDTTLGMEMSYPLTFTNDFGTELTVYALVTDNENVVSSDSEFISANNFSISVALAGTISDVETRTLSNVQVTNKDNSPYTGTITGATASELSAIHSGVEGESFPVTFTSSKGTSITVYVLVTDNNNVVTFDSTFMSARDFSISLDSASTLTGSAANILSNVYVSYFDNSLNPYTGTITADASNIASINMGQVDVSYPLMFRASNGDSIMIHVLVTNDDVFLPGDSSDFMVANNIQLSLLEAQSFTQPLSQSLTNVHVVMSDNSPYLGGISGATASEVQSIVDTTLGMEMSYPLTFTNDFGTELTVYALVTDNENVVSSDSEFISANNFSISVALAGTISDVETRTLSNVQVTNKDNSPYTGTITGATASELSAIHSGVEGESFPVTFTSSKGTSITVYVLVTDNNNVVAFDSTFMSARDFSISLDSASTLTGSAANILSNVYVSYFDNSLNPYTGTITADASNIASINMGQVDVSYPLMFRASNGDSIMIHVLVTNDDVFLPGDSSDFIVANNIQLSLLEAQSFTQPLSQSLTNVHVVMSDNSPYLGGISGATASEVQSIVDTTLGMEMSYPLTFTNDFGTELTVYALVTDNENVVSSDSEFISANNFSISVALAGTISDVETRTLSNVQVTNKDNSPYTGTITGATASELSAIHSGVEGESFPVTFTSSKGTSITVYVLVTDNNNVVAFDSTFMSARDFSISLDSASTLTGSAANILSNVYVSYFDNSLNPYTGTITADASNIASINMGQVDVSYPLMFRASNGDSIMIHVLVTNDDVFLPGDSSDFMVANNIQLSLLEAQSFTQPLSQSLTNVHVVMSDNSPYLGGISGATVSEVQSIVDTTLGMEMSYPLTFTNDFGTELTVYALVTDNENVVSSDSEFISANNFSISVALAGTISDVETRTLSNVQVTNKDNSPYTGTITGATASELSAIHSGVEGESFPVTFTSSKGTSITVYVLVTDNPYVVPNPEAKEFISARDFNVSVDSAITLDDAMSIVLADAKVTLFDNSPYLGSIHVDASEMANINSGNEGSYPLTFASDSGTAVTIHVLVTDNSHVVPNPEAKEFISANDFSISLDSASTLTSSEAIDLSHAMVTNFDNSPYTGTIHVGLSTELLEINTRGKGSYPLTFSSDSGTAVTIHVLVTDNDNVIVNPDSAEFMSAKDFSVSLSEAAALTNEMAKTLSNVEVTNFDNSPYTGTIGVEATELEAIHNSIADRVYPLTFMSSKGTQITVKVLVTDNSHVIINPTEDEFISANDFMWRVDPINHYAFDLDSMKARVASNVMVIDFNNVADNIASILVGEGDELNTIRRVDQGLTVYPLTFTSSKGTPISINVLLTDADTATSNPDSSEFIQANNFRWRLDSSMYLTSELAIDSGHALVTKYDGTTYSDNIDVDQTMLGKIQNAINGEGTYPLTYTSKAGTKVTITVLLTDKDEVVINPVEHKDAIIANNFTISVDSANYSNDPYYFFTTERAKDMADVKAYDLTLTGDLATAGVIDRSLIREDAAQHDSIRAVSHGVGIYPLTFSTPRGTSNSISVFVTDNDSANIDPVTKEAISANHIVWYVDNASQLTEDILKDSSHVKAFQFNTQPYSPIDVATIHADASQLQAIRSVVINQGNRGIYPVTLTTAAGTSVTVSVILVEHDTVVIDDINKVTIGADTIRMSVLDVNTFTDTLALVKSGLTLNDVALGAQLIDHATNVTDFPLISTPKLAFNSEDRLAIQNTLVQGTYYIRVYYNANGVPSSLIDLPQGSRLESSTTELVIPVLLTNSISVSTFDIGGYVLDVHDKFADTDCGSVDSTDSNNRACDVDESYDYKEGYFGIDTMKNTAVISVTIPQQYGGYVPVEYGFVGQVSSSLFSSLPTVVKFNVLLDENGFVTGSSEALDTIVRNNTVPGAKGQLLVIYDLGTFRDTAVIKISADFDGDGILNVYERNTCIKRRSGNIPNEWYYDSSSDDADGDGITNSIESNWGSNPYMSDDNNNCIPNFLDEDSNGNGIPDSINKFTPNSPDSSIFVTQAISPNGDGLGNEKMYIGNLPANVHPTVAIFDRKGRVIYKVDEYNNATNAFSGYPNQGSTTSLLPMGSYYYYIEFTNPTTQKTETYGGFIEIRY